MHYVLIDHVPSNYNSKVTFICQIKVDILQHLKKQTSRRQMVKTQKYDNSDSQRKFDKSNLKTKLLSELIALAMNR